MWQSTISLRYVSYKNADSNLHERICAMAMMAKSLLWSCVQIVAPRPPTNPQRPNDCVQATPGCGLQGDRENGSFQVSTPVERDDYGGPGDVLDDFLEGF